MRYVSESAVLIVWVQLALLQRVHAAVAPCVARLAAQAQICCARIDALDRVHACCCNLRGELAAQAQRCCARLATFYSRSRKERWCKGETSGHFINVTGVYADCDRDSLVYLGEPVGPACHTVRRHPCVHWWELQMTWFWPDSTQLTPHSCVPVHGLAPEHAPPCCPGGHDEGLLPLVKPDGEHCPVGGARAVGSSQCPLDACWSSEKPVRGSHMTASPLTSKPADTHSCVTWTLLPSGRTKALKLSLLLHCALLGQAISPAVSQGGRTCWFTALELQQQPEGAEPAQSAALREGSGGEGGTVPLPTLQALEQTILQRSQQGNNGAVRG